MLLFLASTTYRSVTKREVGGGGGGSGRGLVVRGPLIGQFLKVRFELGKTWGLKLLYV